MNRRFTAKNNKINNFMRANINDDINASKRLTYNENNSKSYINHILKPKTNNKEIFFTTHKNSKLFRVLFNDNDKYTKDPFSENLISNICDEDIESTDDNIANGKNYLIKELNYGILSAQQNKKKAKFINK